MPRLSISATFTLKEMPKGQPGYRGGSFNFGKSNEVPLSQMMSSVCMTILEHYLCFVDAETLNAELDQFRTAMSTVRVETQERPYDDPDVKVMAR
jgi:hypothetical protein